jgi:hypothetical protein
MTGTGEKRGQRFLFIVSSSSTTSATESPHSKQHSDFSVTELSIMSSEPTTWKSASDTNFVAVTVFGYEDVYLLAHKRCAYTVHLSTSDVNSIDLKFSL